VQRLRSNTHKPHVMQTPLRCSQVDNEILEKAHYLLRPVCLRRLKEDVEKTLPPRVGANKPCTQSTCLYHFLEPLRKSTRMQTNIDPCLDSTLHFACATLSEAIAHDPSAIEH